MTAPALDLDTLEARLLDAERNDLLVEHGVRFTDIKWLIAAARERDAERQQRERAEQREARLRAALEFVREHSGDPVMERAIDAALEEGQDG